MIDSQPVVLIPNHNDAPDMSSISAPKPIDGGAKTVVKASIEADAKKLMMEKMLKAQMDRMVGGGMH
jgi:hypothetical protein